MIYIAAKYGTQILGVWMPEHKAQFESSADIVEGAAVAYGLIAAGDAKMSVNQPVKEQPKNEKVTTIS
jgi:hypothetical protein